MWKRTVRSHRSEKDRVSTTSASAANPYLQRTGWHAGLVLMPTGGRRFGGDKHHTADVSRCIERVLQVFVPRQLLCLWPVMCLVVDEIKTFAVAAASLGLPSLFGFPRLPVFTSKQQRAFCDYVCTCTTLKDCCCRDHTKQSIKSC